MTSGQGADDAVDGRSRIRRFEKEPFPQILVSANMLDTGFDCREAVSLVFARFTRSAILCACSASARPGGYCVAPTDLAVIARLDAPVPAA